MGCGKHYIIRTLLEQWVRVVGHRDIPGQPACMPPRQFLDYFSLTGLDELPSSVRDLEEIGREMSKTCRERSNDSLLVRCKSGLERVKAPEPDQPS